MSRDIPTGGVYQSDPLEGLGAEWAALLAQAAALAERGLSTQAAAVSADLLARVRAIVAERSAALASSDLIVVRNPLTGNVYHLPLSAITGNLGSAPLVLETMESAQLAASPIYILAHSNGDIYCVHKGATSLTRVNKTTLAITATLTSASWGYTDAGGISELSDGRLASITDGGVDLVNADLTGASSDTTGNARLYGMGGRIGADWIGAQQSSFQDRIAKLAAYAAGTPGYVTAPAKVASAAPDTANALVWFLTLRAGGWRVYSCTSALTLALVGDNAAGTVVGAWGSTSGDYCRNGVRAVDTVFFRSTDTTWGTARVYWCDVSSGAVGEIALGTADVTGHPVYVAATGRVYVPSGGYVFVINPSTRRIERKVALAASVYGAAPRAYSAALGTDGYLYILDTANRSVRRFIP